MTREIPFRQFWDGQQQLWGEPEMAGAPHALQEVIEKVLAEFSEDDRELLVMSLMGQLSVRQIADNIGLSKSEVHRRLQVLVPELASHLKENDDIAVYLGTDAPDGA